jgi:hypothetical protein
MATQQQVAAVGTDFDAPTEFGRTVEDAERLLRRATRCFLFFKTGRAVLDTGMWEIPKSTVRAELKRRSADEPMPCELIPNVLGGWSLYFSSFGAIEHAAGGHQ